MSQEIIRVAPLSREEVLSLSSDTITKKQHAALLVKIDERFSYVFETAMKLMGRSVQWYDFDNVGSDEGDRGFFDPDYYADEIDIAGEFSTPRDTLYEQSIPTRWLWEDFEEALVAEINTHKQALELAKDKKQQESLAAKQKRSEMIKQIRIKLTKEELAYITFK